MRMVGFIVHPGYSPMSLAATTAFEVANLQPGGPYYDLRLLSEAGGPIRTSLGFSVQTEAFAAIRYHLLIVGGAMEAPALALADFVRHAARHADRIASTCTGAFVLAAAGLLDGRRATTHWARARELQARYPEVRVEVDRIYVADGPIWTSAGMTAGIDLALALIEADLGMEIARAVARKLVVYHRRSGGQSQFSALLELSPKSDRIQTTLTYAKQNLHTRLSVEDLAEVAHLSPRQFSRTFQAETGQSPAKAVENLRLEAARQLMESSRHPIDVVARQTGFADRDRMRRAFLRAFGQPPQVIRRAARTSSTNLGQDRPEARAAD